MKIWFVWFGFGCGVVFLPPPLCQVAVFWHNVLCYFLTENFFYSGGNSVSMIVIMKCSPISVVKICFLNPLFSFVIKLSSALIILYQKLNAMS